ncbi:MarR family transcriptional regulator [Dactylosporangium sp. AC04546]|uniref:MarR family winged helix-turn-helix transcriptional regulator n=1 Tax=Dactylosporangium sp. AC04546 TaxID=2862460 RepID=UPI001EDDF800|nr:MarR family transcriptional regulator [Dactylosporangium sp. AC04546]WVK83319.1 MarR family transcriptional regulator [Dactylosporangium sp. AC04546]
MGDQVERERALGLVLELVVLLEQDMSKRLEQDHLSSGRTAVLWVIRERGPITQRELAEARNVTPRNITGLVDGLETAGLVRRTPHPTDRRATLVELTAAGTAVVERLEQEQREFTDLLFDGMPEAQFESLTQGLDEIVRRIKGAL